MRLARALVAVALACAGCATKPPSRTEPPAIEPAPVAAPEAVEPAPPAEAPLAPTLAPAIAVQRDVWQRVRDGFAFADCPGSSASRRWQRIYTQGPDRFAKQLAQALPMLEFVLARLEARGLPTEFALLPIVESWYTPFAARGNRPAGIWQMMPVTARGLGLEIDGRYDGRLDGVAATDAALDLLKHLHDALGPDWRLVDMAFNAGEYRVRGALKRAGGTRKRVDPDRLPVSRITHDHLAKLTALACIVEEPQRHRVTLPAFDAELALGAVPIEHDTDFELLAALAGLDVRTLRELNPAHSGTHVVGGRSVLLPRARNERFVEMLASIPPARRTGWRRMQPGGDASWDSLATAAGIELAVLVAINADVATSAPSTRPRLLPPGASGTPVAAAAPLPATARDGRYRVRDGDSLWKIARAFGVRIADLLTWNGIDAKKPIRPGQWLRVIAP